MANFVPGVSFVVDQAGGGPYLPGVGIMPLPTAAGTYFADGKTTTPSIPGTPINLGGDQTGLYMASRGSIIAHFNRNEVYRIPQLPAEGEPYEFTSLVPPVGTLPNGYGKVALVLPMEEGDAILFGTRYIARVAGGVELWRIAQSDLVPAMAIAAGAAGNTVTVIYWQVSSATTGTVRYLSFNADTPPASTSQLSWPGYTYDADTMSPSGSYYDPQFGGLLAAVATNFDYAVMSLNTGFGADGWFPGMVATFSNAFQDGAGYSMAGFSPYQSPSNPDAEEVWSIIITTTLAGGSIADVTVETSEVAVTSANLVLPPPRAGYAYSIQPWPAIVLTQLVPDDPTPFWTNLRRAVEVI